MHSMIPLVVGIKLAHGDLYESSKDQTKSTLQIGLISKFNVLGFLKHPESLSVQG